MAVVATAEFLYSHTAFMIAVAMIPFILLLTNRQYKTATVFFCLFAAGLFVQAIQNSVQFPMIVNMLVVLLVGLVLRLFPGLVMGPTSSNPLQPASALPRWAGCAIGRQITIPLSVLFRFKSLPCRRNRPPSRTPCGCGRSSSGQRNSGKTPRALIEYRFIPLMISVVKIGDDLSAAALTRGLDNLGSGAPISQRSVLPAGTC